jgi:EF-hand domain pair
MKPAPIALAGVLLGLSLSFPGLADPSSKGAAALPASFSIHDTNQDGYIDRQEYQRFREQVRAAPRARGRGPRSWLPLLEFETIDQNADGRVSEAEMVSTLQQRLHERRRQRHRHGQPR